MEKYQEEAQCMCANSYVQGKETEPVLFSILFSPEDEKRKEGAQSSTAKEAQVVQRNVSVM